MLVAGDFINTVIADRKVGELKMGIAAHFVYVEKIRQIYFSRSQFDATTRDRRLQIIRVGLLFDAVGRERDCVMHKSTGKVDIPAYRGTDDIRIGVGGDAQTV